MAKYYVYALIDKRTAKPFYVGMTRCLASRTPGHVGAEGQKRHGVPAGQIHMTVIGSSDSDKKIRAMEKETISCFLMAGHRLTNKQFNPWHNDHV